MTEIINKGPVDTYTAKGISKQIFKRFITLPTNKQIDATNCNTLTFFIQSPPCVYYSIKVKTNQCGALYIIKTLVLHIIKPTDSKNTPKGVMIYAAQVRQ